MLTVCIGFNSLPSWLMLDPLQTMVEQASVVVDWQPLPDAPINLVASNRNANQSRNIESDPLAAYKMRRAQARASFATCEHERMCDRLGIDYEAGHRSINPLYLSLGLLWIKAANPAPPTCFDYCRSAFHQLFVTRPVVESAAIENSPEPLSKNSPEPNTKYNPETSTGVETLLNKLGITTTGFETFTRNETRLLEANQRKLLESGILHAPAFIVDDEVFLGREHLPLITWMLQGRVGLPPV